MNYSKMKKDELKQLCREYKIKGISRKNKYELIDIINQMTTKPVLERNINEKIYIESESIKVINMSFEDYEYLILEIKSVAESIIVYKADGDGRIDSAMKEKPFLNEMKKILMEKHQDWEVVISPPRASCDIMINSIRINLKLTDCKSSDNSVNKPSIYFSITGLTTYPYSSNWNAFLDRLTEAKTMGMIKKRRYKPTEYHYLVKNKLTGDVILKSIFDIHTYVSNASNDLQINWKNEFLYSEYHIEEFDYLKKVKSLLNCIQKSVKEMIERTVRYAEADIDSLLTLEE